MPTSPDREPPTARPLRGASAWTRDSSLTAAQCCRQYTASDWVQGAVWKKSQFHADEVPSPINPVNEALLLSQSAQLVPEEPVQALLALKLPRASTLSGAMGYPCSVRKPMVSSTKTTPSGRTQCTPAS